MVKFKEFLVLTCILLISNLAFAMERGTTDFKGPVVQAVKMERGDEEAVSECICNENIFGLVERKKNDGSTYKEVCVVETIPAVLACTIMSVTFFCFGCPK